MTSKFQFTCNLLVEPSSADRFYMDMRVYSVVPTVTSVEASKSGPLVWRGIYLACQVDPATQKNDS